MLQGLSNYTYMLLNMEINIKQTTKTNNVMNKIRIRTKPLYWSLISGELITTTTWKLSSWVSRIRWKMVHNLMFLYNKNYETIQLCKCVERYVVEWWLEDNEMWNYVNLYSFLNGCMYLYLRRDTPFEQEPFSIKVRLIPFS